MLELFHEETILRNSRSSRLHMFFEILRNFSNRFFYRTDLMAASKIPRKDCFTREEVKI